MMVLSVQVIILAIGVVLFGILLLAVLILIKKGGHDREAQRCADVEQGLIAHVVGDPLELPTGRRSRRRLLNRFVSLKQAVALSEAQQSDIVRALTRGGILADFDRKLRSHRSIRRIEGASYLGYLGTDAAWDYLVVAFAAEKKPIVKYRLAVALYQIAPDESVPLLLASLTPCTDWYFDRVSPLLLDSGRALHTLIPSITDTTDTRLQELVIEFAARYPAQDLKDYLLAKAHGDDQVLALSAVRSLAAVYHEELADDFYLQSDFVEVRLVALGALTSAPNFENLALLLEVLAGAVGEPDQGDCTPIDDRTATFTIHAIADILRREPALMPNVVRAFEAAPGLPLRQALAEVLSFRIQYFLLKLLGRERGSVRELVQQVLAVGKTSETIGFLNRNRNIEIENETLAAIRGAISQNPELKDQFRHYLDPRILKKLKLDRREFVRAKRDERREKGKLVFLYVILIVVILIFPTIYLLRHFATLTTTGGREQLSAYVIDFNYVLIFYAAALQLFTMALLLLAYLGARGQARAWAAKPVSLLFRPGALPSISIVAPAYCEEATIVESANSLLSVQYPDVELVIVNDGSSDETLNRLIGYFELEKVDRIVQTRLNTQPIRGVYVNPAFPQLVVVDKANGGKADSLNAGINMSTKEYFCGIDADSLLEADSLLKVASGCLDTQDEVVAAGGNIFPINGCTVERGTLAAIRLPRSSLARFQTIEYIRAFMAGRVGWSYLKSLLIISGAFGLFKRDRVIEVGGYLTDAGIYGRDTVGEDMELVVRLKRDMITNRVAHQINYAYNANCWTEVPEDLTVLHGQRDRWQRGLIDIVYFHRRLMFNPRYGRMGLVALPYFFIFELVGPLVEVQGYVMVLAAAILGLLNPQIALLLFLTVILMGVFVSMLSLYIAENEANYFTNKEVGVLIGYSIIENFGYRQLSSIWRVTGFLSAMRKPKGWGKMVRKGFAPTPPAS